LWGGAGNPSLFLEHRAHRVPSEEIRRVGQRRLRRATHHPARWVAPASPADPPYPRTPREPNENAASRGRSTAPYVRGLLGAQRAEQVGVEPGRPGTREQDAADAHRGLVAIVVEPEAAVVGRLEGPLADHLAV